jgi:hypothetical protein
VLGTPSKKLFRLSLVSFVLPAFRFALRDPIAGLGNAFVSLASVLVAFVHATWSRFFEHEAPNAFKAI